MIIEVSEINLGKIKDRCKLAGFGEKMITKDFIEGFVNSVIDLYFRDPSNK